MDPLIGSAMAIGLIAAYPGWRMCRKAYLISRRRWVMAPMCLVVPFLLAGPIFFVPFLISKGKEVVQYHTLSDLVIFAICPLGLLALIAYVLDHVSEKPTRAMLAGAACFAVAMLPILFYVYADEMHVRFDITFQQN